MLKKFFRKNNLFYSLLFFPFIYLVGWVLISLFINVFPFLELNKSLYGTIITFLMFLCFLPFWSNHRWGKNLSKLLGIKDLGDKKLFTSYISEFLKALIIISVFIFILIKGEFVLFQTNLNLNLSLIHI